MQQACREQDPLQSRGDSESQQLQSLPEGWGSKVSVEVSSPNLGLVLLKKAGVVDWPRTLGRVSQSTSRGPAGGRQKPIRRVRKTPAILEICHLNYLAMAPLAIYLSAYQESV